MKTIIIGDVHIKDKEYWSDYAHPLFFQWLSEQKASHYIFTGDFFDNTTPTWNLWNKARQWIELISDKEVHIVQGNHEISNIKGNILPSFIDQFPDNVYCYTDVSIREIGNNKFLFLPFLNGSRQEMIDRYNSLDVECDYIVSHISPVGKNFGQEESNLTNIKCKKKFYGHIHENSEEEDRIVIGVPVPTRHGEINPCYVYEVSDSITKIEIPKFIDFVNIEYDSEIELTKGNIYNVKNAPSVREALKKFEGHWIRKEGISLIRSEYESEEEINNDFFTSDLQGKFKSFAKENKLSQEIIEESLMALNEVTN